MNAIEFEGILVKPNRKGIYSCPYKCGNPYYPQPQWKTESGFRKHMAACTGSPSAKLLEEVRSKESKTKHFSAHDNALKKAPYKIGESLIWIRKVVIKPSYERRGNRVVRVRYYDVVEFRAEEIAVVSVDWTGSEREGQYIMNGHSDFGIFYGSLADAHAEARRRQHDYDEMVLHHDNS